MRRHGNTVALLGALCLFLSTIEYLIPKPLPFMRLGIANVPLMLSLDIFMGEGNSRLKKLCRAVPDFFLLVLIKVTGQALVTGTLFSYLFLFSLAGTSCAACVMFTLCRLCRLCGQRISFIGVSVASALVSNAAQLSLAYFFIFGKSVLYTAPPFLAAGLITGAALGVFCEYFSLNSQFFRFLKIGEEGGASV